MTSPESRSQCDWAPLTSSHVLGGVPEDEVPALQAHFAACDECRMQLESLRSLVDSFALWPNDVLRPSQTLRERLALRINAETHVEFPLPAQRQRAEPAWEQVAPGISCKVLATDAKNDRVSMLVHLAPGIDYPPHTHAGREELYLLDGELWIDDRKLYPGDYQRAEVGTADRRVWSETGCTCVLITSTRDVIA